MRFFLLFAVLIISALPAQAQDMLSKHRANDPMAKLLGDEKVPETLNDYANLYFKSCSEANTDETLQEYVDTQCSCTTAEMVNFMTLQDMKSLFTKTREGDFQQGRVMLLAYAPCLQESLHDYLFDSCFYDTETRKKVRYPRRVCECLGTEMGEFFSSHGQNYIPGFTRTNYDSTQSVPNPLEHIIKGDILEYIYDYRFNLCVMHEEYKWNK